MSKDVERLRQLLREGRCCAVALVQLGLELRKEVNPQLLQAMSALCGGLQSGRVCGALSGAACMMNVLDPENANAHMVPELVEWFAETMGKDFGGVDCREITDGNPTVKAMRCPGLVEATYLQAKQILQDFGHEFE
ncbi:MAG TPA: C-GCAxxG-C-C family protein [Holophaga sp.]|nr:C-GCAxxG-C-C family protein [Holophaga sp.]